MAVSILFRVMKLVARSPLNNPQHPPRNTPPQIAINDGKYNDIRKIALVMIRAVNRDFLLIIPP